MAKKCYTNEIDPSVKIKRVTLHPLDADGNIDLGVNLYPKTLIDGVVNRQGEPVAIQEKLTAGDNISIEDNIISAIVDHPADVYTKEESDEKFATKDEVSGKQDILVSGENIKTINNISILGEGDIRVQGKEIENMYWFGLDYYQETDKLSFEYYGDPESFQEFLAQCIYHEDDDSGDERDSSYYSSEICFAYYPPDNNDGNEFDYIANIHIYPDGSFEVYTTGNTCIWVAGNINLETGEVDQDSLSFNVAEKSSMSSWDLNSSLYFDYEDGNLWLEDGTIPSGAFCAVWFFYNGFIYQAALDTWTDWRDVEPDPQEEAGDGTEEPEQEQVHLFELHGVGNTLYATGSYEFDTQNWSYTFNIDSINLPGGPAPTENDEVFVKQVSQAVGKNIYPISQIIINDEVYSFDDFLEESQYYGTNAYLYDNAFVFFPDGADAQYSRQILDLDGNELESTINATIIDGVRGANYKIGNNNRSSIPSQPVIIKLIFNPGE